MVMTLSGLALVGTHVATRPRSPHTALSWVHPSQPPGVPFRQPGTKPALPEPWCLVRAPKR